jgi:hypothetical protein
LFACGRHPRLPVHIKTSLSCRAGLFSDLPNLSRVGRRSEVRRQPNEKPDILSCVAAVLARHDCHPSLRMSPRHPSVTPGPLLSPRLSARAWRPSPPATNVTPDKELVSRVPQSGGPAETYWLTFPDNRHREPASGVAISLPCTIMANALSLSAPIYIVFAKRTGPDVRLARLPNRRVERSRDLHPAGAVDVNLVISPLCDLRHNY